MNKVAILGPGLLGGSLALALKARLPGCRTALWARREAAVDEARKRGVADLASTDLAPVLEDARLVIFCVPVEVMPGLARQVEPLIPPGALVTDVGSVKEPVVEELSAIFRQRGRFIGSHPMAGSEQSGLSAAREDLFEGAVCILTPHPGVAPETEREMAAFWRLVGGTVRTLSPRVHDETIGLASHLPHLLASALVDFVCAENADSLHYCGNGFRDTTRIASGPAEMWTGILAANRKAVSGQLRRFIARLEALCNTFETGDDRPMHELLHNAKVQRDRLTASNQ